jgi:hypothetical protein
MLHDLTQIIRGQLGNEGFHRHGLDVFHHANACAAVDVLEDADLAIAHYLESESSGEPGSEYLRTYGVLQAAYLQQDAARLIRKAFGLPSSEWPKPMYDLRVLRNRATGHPADTPEGKRKPADTPKRKSDPPATFIVRPEMSSRSLAVLQIAADGTWNSSSVDLRAMLKAHSEALHSLMEELVDELERRERERREDIAARGPVSALMHPSWRWMLQKIHEASLTPDETAATLAQPSVPCLLKTLDEVERSLVERGIDPPHSWHVETARAALDRLPELLQRAVAGEAVQLDIAAFATLAEQHLTAISKFLEEIDERLKNS